MERTSYLPDDATYSERFYVIEHDLTSRKLCPVCNECYISFNKQQNSYIETCGRRKCVVQTQDRLDYEEIERKKAERKNRAIDNIINLRLPIMSIDETINKIEEIEIERIRISAHSDVICSLFYHTKKIFPNFENVRITQRYYHLKNKFDHIPLCECGRPRTYINSVSGYSETCGDIVCRTNVTSKSKRDNTSDQVKTKLLNNGYKIIKFDYLNSGNPVTLICPNGHEFTRFIHNGRWEQYHDLCLTCNDSHLYSLEEKTFLSEIKEYYDGDIIENYRLCGKEIDIYFPDKSIGIEYNGIYWHSYDTKESKEQIYKHLSKTEIFEQNGISVIQINSYDYKTKKQIVHSRIKNLLNLSNKIFARKCKIVKLTTFDETNFFNRTHFQGYGKSSIAYGLIYDNKLVAAMSFCKPRFNHNFEFELLRFSTELDTNVIGGASKLFTHFVKNHTPKNMISYASRDWSSGKMYSKLGFTNFQQTHPNFIFTKGNSTIKRYDAQKHKLPKLLGELYDDNMSAVDNMFNAGYRRYWDCGSIKMEWHSNG